MNKKISPFLVIVILISLFARISVAEVGNDEIKQDEVFQSNTLNLEPVTESNELLDEPSIINNDEASYVNIDELISPLIEEVNISHQTIDEVHTNSSEELLNWTVNDTQDTITNNSLDYINIDELVNITKDDNLTFFEKTQKTLVKDGRIELEYKATEGENIEIIKKELIKNDFEKVIKISSDIHVEDELRVYSDLPKEAIKEDISITWDNEHEEVKGIEYYDENDNGLIDRVSWKVPHLSTQTYTITISSVGIATSTSSIILGVVSPQNNSNITNPGLFSFTIDYINYTDVSCELYIYNSSGALYNSSYLPFDTFNSSNINLNLNEGSNTWRAYCHDTLNQAINKSIFGYFNVIDNFNISMGSFYMKSEVGSGISTQLLDSGGTVELTLQNQQANSSLANLTGVTNTTYTIPSGNLGNSGSYILYAKSYYYSAPAYASRTFYVGDVKANYNGSVNNGDTVIFSLKFNSTISGTYDLFIGSVQVVNDRVLSSGTNVGENISYKTNISGNNQPIIIETTFGGRAVNTTVGTINIADTGDKQDPDIKLKYPGWQKTIGSSEITFVYSVSDNVKVKNCSLSIYNTTDKNSGVYEPETLLFPLGSSDKNLAQTSNVKNDENITVKLVDFEEESYIWEVECFDDSGNRAWDFNYFKVVLDNASSLALTTTADSYSKEGDVQSLIDSINSYLEKEKSFGPDEMRVIDVLGIGEKMNLDKKKLLQFDNDLKYNLKFMEESKRNIRMQEIYAEIDSMKEEVISGLILKNKYEYSKNSLDTPLEDIITSYLNSIEVDSKTKVSNNLVQFNKALQNNMTYKTNAWDVELNYVSGVKKLLVVEKNMNFRGEFAGQILEFIPESLGKPVFLTSVKEVGKEVYEFYKNDLKDNSLIYYFEENLNEAALEKTETILFEEGVVSKSLITGFFTTVGGGNMSIITIIIGVLFMGYVGFWIFGKIKVNTIRKENGAEEMFNLIEKTKEYLRLDQVDNARIEYIKMNEVYKSLSPKVKEYFFDELKLILNSINKKDVMNLIKEYEKAKDEFRKDDAETLYTKINLIYKKLPKKFQDRVYRRLIKKEIN